MHPAGRAASAMPSASRSADHRLDLVGALDRRDQHGVGGVDDGEARDAEHAEEAAVGAQVAVGDVAGADPALADDAASSRGLRSQTAFQSPMSDQAKSAATTAARAVRSITAWSKLIFGAAAKPRRGASAPRSSGPSSMARADRLERLRRVLADLAQAGVGAEAEHSGVPEAALLAIRSAARAASGFSTKRSTAPAPAPSASPRAM